MIDKNLMSKILDFEENFEKKLELENIEHIYDYCILVYYISLIPELTENEKKTYLQKGRYYLKIFLKNIKKYPNYTGSWYGITGILYIMHALSINNDLDDKIKYLERIVIDSTRQNFLIQKPALTCQNHYFDIVTGISGIAIYFLNYSYNQNLNFINEIKKWIKDYLISVLTFIKCSEIKENIDDENYKFFLDLGVSHGILGPLFCLSKIYEKDNDQDVFNLIKEFLKIYREFLKTDNCVSKFPSSIYKNVINNSIYYVYPNRTGWCYGSLGIYRILYLICKNLDDQEMIHLIEEDIIKFSNYDIKLFNFICPTFCHGYSSAMYIFKLFLNDGVKINSLILDNLFDEIWHTYNYKLPYFFPKYDIKNEKIYEKNNRTSFIDGAVSIIITTIMTKIGVETELFSISLVLKN